MKMPTPFAAYATLVVALASVMGAVLPILLFQANWVISVPVVLATAFPLLVFISRNPRLFFLVAMVFTAPLGLSINMRSHNHMGGAHALSINLMDFFLLPLLVFLARDYYVGYRRDFRFSAISWWWLGLTALGLYSVVVGPYREIAMLEVVRMIKLWLLFIVVVNECVREKHFHYVVMALAGNAALNIAVALVQYALKRSLGLQSLGEGSDLSSQGANLGVYGSDSDVFRVTGLAGHANLFGAYLAMLLPIFVAQLNTSYRMTIKLMLAAVSLGGLACLALTLSRSAWASFAVSGTCLMVALFVWPELRKRHLTMKVGMLVTGLVGVLLASGQIVRRLTQSDPGAVDFRIEWVGVAWKMVQDWPLLGIGLNSFIYHLGEYAPYSVARMYDLFGDVFPVVHNIYMIVWSEQGTVGLLVFVGMHLHLLWIAYKNLRYRGLSDKIFLVNLAAACGILAIMVDGLSSFFIRVQAFGRVFWIVAGLIVAAHIWNTRNQPLRQETASSA